MDGDSVEKVLLVFAAELAVVAFITQGVIAFVRVLANGDFNHRHKVAIGLLVLGAVDACVKPAYKKYFREANAADKGAQLQSETTPFHSLSAADSHKQE